MTFLKSICNKWQQKIKPLQQTRKANFAPVKNSSQACMCKKVPGCPNPCEQLLKNNYTLFGASLLTTVLTDVKLSDWSIMGFTRE